MGALYYLEKRVRDIVNSVRWKIIRLIRLRGREINVDVFANPEKHMVRLPIDKIIADSKVSREGVEKYKEKIKKKEKVAPIIVVKHPRFEAYAVLDGHHRYYAYLELGKKEINCALAGDISSVMFYMTEHGFFQPKKEMREEMRRPIPFFHENIDEFLHNFLKDPNKPKYSDKEKKSQTA
jgi:hypothetical protein